MENKLIKLFMMLLVLICGTFTICMIIQLYTLILYGTIWISWFNFLWVLLTPFVGYLMMITGEYIDNKIKEKHDDTEHLLSTKTNKKRLIESIEHEKKRLDSELMRIYMLGFTDELDNKHMIKFDDNLENRAYNLGRLDALVGDSVRSVDYKSTQEIINHIKNTK